GEWQQPLFPYFAHLSRFSVDDHTTVEVQMMSRLGRYGIYFDNELPCMVLRVPYKNRGFILFVTPELGKLREVEEALSQETIIRWKNSTKGRFVHLIVPKFSISSSLNLNEILSDIGMTDVFSKKADFSGITEDFHLKVSK
ncbi:hypothetical protein FKM82_029705, partial [Ascaphus truei]